MEKNKANDMWRAWAVTEGSHTKIVVEGIYGMGGPGRVAVVSYAVPQGINPDILLLKLTVSTLPGAWAQVLCPIPAVYVKSPYKKNEYQGVEILYPDGSLASVDVIVDTDAGPN